MIFFLHLKKMGVALIEYECLKSPLSERGCEQKSKNAGSFYTRSHTADGAQLWKQPTSRSEQETRWHHQRQGWNQDPSWGHGVSAIKCKRCASLRPAPWWSNPAPSPLIDGGSWKQPVCLLPSAEAVHHLQRTVGLLSACRSPQSSRRTRRGGRASAPLHPHGKSSAYSFMWLRQKKLHRAPVWHSKSSLIRQISSWELEQTILPLREAAGGLQTGSICLRWSVVIFQIPSSTPAHPQTLLRNRQRRYFHLTLYPSASLLLILLLQF